MSTVELKALAKMVIEEGIAARDAALVFNVKPRMVWKLVHQVRCLEQSYNSIRERQETRQHQREQAAEFVAGKLKQGDHIWTAQQVKTSLLAEANLNLSVAEVRKVLREKLNMRYRVLKKVEYQGNSERCLVTRMLYAQKMLELLGEGKRIINIDETWLPHLDFRSKKWRQRGERNTISARQLGHRVNMIAALDTDGNIYMSLTQFSTDSDVMLMFMTHLCTTLTSE